jgi:hypothetical protein
MRHLQFKSRSVPPKSVESSLNNEKFTQMVCMQFVGEMYIKCGQVFFKIDVLQLSKLFLVVA